MVVVLTSGKVLSIHLWLVVIVLGGALYGAARLVYDGAKFMIWVGQTWIEERRNAALKLPVGSPEPRYTAAEWEARQRDAAAGEEL